MKENGYTCICNSKRDQCVLNKFALLSKKLLLQKISCSNQLAHLRCIFAFLEPLRRGILILLRAIPIYLRCLLSKNKRLFNNNKPTVMCLLTMTAWETLYYFILLVELLSRQVTIEEMNVLFLTISPEGQDVRF